VKNGRLGGGGGSKFYLHNRLFANQHSVSERCCSYEAPGLSCDQSLAINALKRLVDQLEERIL